MHHSLELHGVRGSMPVDGEAFVEHGGATTCYSLRIGGDTIVVVDAGTGIRSLIPVCRARHMTVHLLLTHYHHDHVNGLPFFAPALDDSARLVVYGRPSSDGTGVAEAVRGFMRPPWFPVSFGDVAARTEFVELGDRPVDVAGIGVTTAALNHPQGVTGYRFETNRCSLVVATDHEHGNPVADAALRGLAAGADVLLHDAQYLPDEYPAHRGWGHSTWEHAVDAAAHAGAGRLVLVSHDPCRSDAAVDAIADAARAVFPGTVAGRRGMSIPL